MSADGARWYQRIPAKWIAGTQGMSTTHHAVYSLIVDLIYAAGAPVANDPKFIAGHFSDIGTAKARNVITSLIADGYLIEEPDGYLSNERAMQTMDEMRRKSETNSKNGQKGGKVSAEVRAKNAKQADLFAAEEEKREERERQDDFPERVALAMGRGSRTLRSEEAVMVRSWRDELHLTEEAILQVVAEVTAASNAPISSPKYYLQAVLRLADSKAQGVPALPAQPPPVPQAVRRKKRRRKAGSNNIDNLTRAFVGGASDDGSDD